MNWPPPTIAPVWCAECGMHHARCRFCGEVTTLSMGRRYDAHGPGPHHCEVAACLDDIREGSWREPIVIPAKSPPPKQKGAITAPSGPRGVVM